MGQRLGYKQTAEHIRKRFLNGSPNRKGDRIVVRSGRTRALRMFPTLPAACEGCGEDKKLERHHKDENTLNNERENIAFLCRRCHMIADGRLEKFKEINRGR